MKQIMKLDSNKWPFTFFKQLAVMWYSIIAGIIATGMIAFVVLYIESQERDHIDRVTESTANEIKLLLEKDIRKQITSLWEFARLSKISSNMSENDWNLISQYLSDTQQKYQAIGWVDRSLNPRKIFIGNSNKKSFYFELSFSELSAALDANESENAVITVPLDANDGRRGLGIYIPVFNTTQTKKSLEGFIYSALIFDLYIKAVLPSHFHNEHQLTLFIDDQKIYSEQSDSEHIPINRDKQAFFYLQGQRWQINVVPKNEFLLNIHVRMLIILILLGILLSLFIAIVFYTTISAHNRTKEIKNDRNKIQQLLNNLPGMAYQSLIISDRPMIFVSEGCMFLTGYPKQEFEQHSILLGHLIHPDDYERVNQTVHKAVLTKSLLEIEYRIITKNDGVRLMWERAELVRSIINDEVILEGFITDITSIKQAEVDLIHSKNFSDAIVNSVVDAVITIDCKGLIKSFNQAAQNMFDYTYDEIKGKNVKILMPQQYYRQHDQYLAQLIITKEANFIDNGRELVAKRKDGSTFQIQLFMSEFHSHENRIFVGLIRDITQQRKLGEQTRMHTEKLTHANRLSLLGEMTTGIAHEINQPLTAISLFSKTAINVCEKCKFDKPTTILEKLSQHSRRATTITERVQIKTRGEDRAKKIIECSILIDEVIKLAEKEGGLNDINIEVLITNTHTKILVDQAQIQQVILNLLRNSKEAMQAIAYKNGVIIELQIHLNSEHYIEVSVVDTGCGLSKKVKQTLFTPLFSTKKYRTGVGLAISKSIIEGHGGRIHYCENKPAGAIFYFTLPIHEKRNFNDG